MQKSLPAELENALEAFEAGALDKIIRKRRRGDFQALLRLISLDADVKPHHRQRAINALGRWEDASVVSRIVELLPKLPESHCITALEALGRLGTKQACKAVESFADHRSPQVRKFVVSALNRIGGSAAESCLRKMAKEDSEDWVRDLAVKRLKAQKKNA